MLTWGQGYRHKRLLYVPIFFFLLPVYFLTTAANYAGRHYGARGMLLRSTINAKLTSKDRASNNLWGEVLPAVAGLVDDEQLKIRRTPSYPALRNTSAPFLLGQGGEEGGKTHPFGVAETAGECFTVGGYNITLPKRPRARKNLSDPYSVPLFVMLPLDTITWNHTISHRDRLDLQLKSLKAVGYTPLSLALSTPHVCASALEYTPFFRGACSVRALHAKSRSYLPKSAGAPQLPRAVGGPLAAGISTN